MAQPPDGVTNVTSLALIRAMRDLDLFLFDGVHEAPEQVYNRDASHTYAEVRTREGSAGPTPSPPLCDGEGIWVELRWDPSTGRLEVSKVDHE